MQGPLLHMVFVYAVGYILVDLGRLHVCTQLATKRILIAVSSAEMNYF